jgi:ribosomal protein S18 acetylase RimI-like enzyme
MEITFQKATVGDINKFVEIEKTSAGLGMYSSMTDPEEAKEEIENNEVYFIKKDGEIVGSTEYQMKGPNEAYLGGLIIKPDYRGQGIARKAIEFRLDKLQGIKRLWLVTHPHNSKMIRMYLSYGFIVEAWRDNYYGDGQPRLVLSREAK